MPFAGGSRYKKSFRSDHPTFNAGVYGVNLDLWRQKAIHKEVLYWMKQVRVCVLCVCMYVCVHVCVCACMCVCIHVLCACMCVCMYCVHVCACMYMCVCVVWMCLAYQHPYIMVLCPACQGATVDIRDTAHYASGRIRPVGSFGPSLEREWCV